MKMNGIITTGSIGLFSLTMLSGIILSSNTTSADTEVIDQVSLTVPIACTMTGEGTSHTATLDPGTYSGATGSEYENGIGKTTLTAICNDDNGFSIYAIGYTGNQYSGENHTKLVGSTTGGTIPTKAYASGDTTSNWSMKLTKVTDSTISYNPQNLTIQSDTEGAFDTWHSVPDTYTKVAEYHANTGSSTTDTTLGVKLETTYAAYISSSQPADTYIGQVKYTLVHPYQAVAGKLNVTYDGNGLTFENGQSTNLVTYDASSSDGTGTVTKISRSQYKENGEYNGYATPGGNDTVTIDGAETIHIKVTYGVPRIGSGGPPSDLYIWPGNHPDYTSANNDTSLTVCGAASATNGAFQSSGSSGSQVTMECDIASDSVTFYDYKYASSTGYYAIVSGLGNKTIYDKTLILGEYDIPTGETGTYKFLGWSSNPDAKIPDYTDEADIINNLPFTNIETTTTLYAIWGRSFNKAFSEMGKMMLGDYYKMQDSSSEICEKVYTGATGELIDTRDNTVYKVGKLNDGKCWMTENLNIAGGTTLSSDDTDFDGSYVLPATDGWTVSSGKLVLPSSPARKTGSNDVDAEFRQENYAYLVNSGNKNNCGDAEQNVPCYSYYSWDTATLGSGRAITGDNIDAPYSICPKGWRLPKTGNIYGLERGDFYALASIYGADLKDHYYSNSSSFHLNAGPGTIPNFILSGYYDEYGGLSSGGHGGLYWSSTSSASSSALRLWFTRSQVFDLTSNPRRALNSVRCLISE